MNNSTYTFQQGKSPLIATAIHDGHEVRQALISLFNLNEEERLREEDPFTANWVNFSDNHIVVHHSRFETDVNRTREKAIYLKPEDAWGLKVWKEDLPSQTVLESLKLYDNFYAEVKKYFDVLFQTHANLVVYDIHSYNYRREGKDLQADSSSNPEINLGTKNMNRQRWAPVVTALTVSLQSFDYAGRTLDVRENIKFKGGYFGQWLYEKYGNKICPVSIEFKKFFMDEWTGRSYEKDILLIQNLLAASKIPVLEALNKINVESGHG